MQENRTFTYHAQCSNLIARGELQLAKKAHFYQFSEKGNSINGNYEEIVVVGRDERVGWMTNCCHNICEFLALHSH
jgi:hypothetical protein